MALRCDSQNQTIQQIHKKQNGMLSVSRSFNLSKNNNVIISSLVIAFQTRMEEQDEVVWGYEKLNLKKLMFLLKDKNEENKSLANSDENK